MNEAPKKIWMDAYSAKYDWNESSSNEDIPYIRADLVDELVKALEILMRNGQKQGWNDSYSTDMKKAKAALAKARGEG